MPDKQTLIDKYWAGTATIEEQLLLLQLLSEADAELEQQLHAAFESDLANNPGLLSEERSETILRNILERGGKLKRPAKVASLRVRWMKYAASAAALLAVVAGAWLLIRHGRPVPVSGLASKGVSAMGANPTVSSKTESYSNTGSKQLVVHLPDSSTVVLLPNSSIAYAKPDRDRRNARLTGAGYFKIATDAKRPFTVLAGRIATSVLGTEFTVNSGEDGRVVIRLMSGKVKVFSMDSGSKLHPIVLAPGEEATIDSGTAKLDAFNAAEERDRFLPRTGPNGQTKEPNLVFDRTPLPRVFEQLGKKYRLHFTYDKDDVRDLQFTGTFLKSDPLPTVLSVICTMNGLAFQQQDGKVSIYKLK